VVCSGICYGAGEEEWTELFRAGWSCEPNHALTVVGDGANVIPMIHVRDLARVIATGTVTVPYRGVAWGGDGGGGGRAERSCALKGRSELS
jgi:hypothetical protein